MKSRTTMTYALALATAATLALAGCSGREEEPTATPSATSSSTGSPSPTGSTSPSATGSPSASASAPIDIPAAAQANTEDGAVAFVRFWFEQVNIAFTTANPAVITLLSTSDCKSCSSLAESPAEFAAKQQRAKPSPFKPLTNVKSLGKDPDGQYRVSFTLAQNTVSVLDASGKVVDTQQGGSAKRVALVTRKGEQWVMRGLAAPQA